MPLTATIAPACSSARCRATGVCVCTCPACASQQRHPRAAFPARHGLRVEAPVAHVVVLGRALLAHRKHAHRGQRAVVGDAFDDRVARAAVGAVDVGVAVAAVLRVEHSREALIAHAGVRGDERARAPVALADVDFELLHHDLDRALLEQRHRVDARQRGCARAHLADELLQRFLGALHLQQHALAVVAHPASQRVPRRRAKHERPETHSLHDPADLVTPRLGSLQAGLMVSCAPDCP